MNTEVDYVRFLDRDDRARYIVDRFGRFLEGPLLDVGCDQARLRKLRPDLEYVGVDIGGEPDLVLDLEQVERLPFDDGQFACVLCSDVLEHLDKIHQLFAELIRVTNRRVIISLPNNWCSARKRIGRGHGKIAHYGLPPEPKLDRHKWFFSATDAVDFVNAQLKKHDLTIEQMIVNEKPRFWGTRFIRRLRYPRFWHYQNLYGHTVWWTLRKTA